MSVARARRIVILIGRFPPGPQGGAEHQAQGWARQLSLRHQVTVVARVEPGGSPGRERREGFDVVRLPLARLPIWRSVHDLSAIDRTLGAMNPRPDIVVCFQTLISGLAGLLIRGRVGAATIVWVRGEGEYAPERSAIVRYLARRVWSGADRVLVQSEAHRLALLRAIERSSPAASDLVSRKLSVVPNGLDLPARVSAPTADGPVLAVGRLIPEKGMDTLIRAAAGLGRPVRIAGTGPEGERLRRLAKELAADVQFAGFVAHDSLGDLYESCACAALASRHGEGLPNGVLEAMARGRPIVATRVAGNRDLIEDGVSGLLVPPDDPAALRAALKRVLEDCALAARLGVGARTTAERFEWSRVTPRLEAILEECAP